jgi:glycosyltransferase involved in cell wall biosynthesis
LGKSKFIFQCVPYDAGIAGSHYFYEQAINTFHAPRSKWHKIYYGINIDRYVSEKKKSTDRIQILLIARFKERKGQKIFIKALSILNERLVDINISGLMIGSCDSASPLYLKEMKEDIDRYGLAKIALIKERVSWEEMPKMIKNADIIVLPSQKEGFGLALIEGMAAGKPVIGTRVSGITEIISDKKTGLLIKPDSAVDLARAIAYLIHDHKLAKNIARLGQISVKKKFDVRKMAYKTEQLYKCLLREK